MHRILIISPHFPPVNAPDAHRVRMALPHLRALGWEPTVLAVSPDMIEGAVIEPALVCTFPDDIRVVRVTGISAHYTRPLGFGSLWWRTGRALRRAGDRLLASGDFDLVFFSTTQFNTFTLGPRWQTRFGVPYVLDYQDPWVNDHYRHAGERPPGGSLRFWLSQLSARRHEPEVVKQAAGIVTVSPAYLTDLVSRYPDLDQKRIRHIPFGAADQDQAVALRHKPERPLIGFDDGLIHVVYAGRCVPGMNPALTLLFRAFRIQLEHNPDEARRFRFHFIGTDYTPPPLAQYTVLPIAQREGVADYVTEHPARVPYFDALHYSARADVILVLGSDDPGYNASKLHACLLTGRPLLCIAHIASPIYRTGLLHTPDTTFGFDEKTSPEKEVRRLAETWFSDHGYRSHPTEALDQLADHTAEAMTRELSRLFSLAARHRPILPTT